MEYYIRYSKILIIIINMSQYKNNSLSNYTRYYRLLKLCILLFLILWDLNYCYKYKSIRYNFPCIWMNLHRINPVQIYPDTWSPVVSRKYTFSWFLINTETFEHFIENESRRIVFSLLMCLVNHKWRTVSTLSRNQKYPSLLMKTFHGEMFPCKR